MKQTRVKVVASVALCASLLIAVAAPQRASAHLLVKDEGDWVWVRYTIKGAQGQLLRVRRNSVDAKRAFWFARQAAKRASRKSQAVAAPIPSHPKGPR